MSQLPPIPQTGAPMYTPQPQKGNLAAVFSLICGILLCIPGLGVLAVILGIVGIAKGNKPNTGGKGMAIAGLILGVFGLIWTVVALAIGGAGFAAWRYGAPARDATHQFVADLAAGNQSAAMADCVKDMDPAKVDQLMVEAKQWGAFKDTLLPVSSIQTTNGETTAMVGGAATFDKGSQPVVATLKKEGDKFKVSEFSFTKPPTQQ